MIEAHSTFNPFQVEMIARFEHHAMKFIGRIAAVDYGKKPEFPNLWLGNSGSWEFGGRSPDLRSEFFTEELAEKLLQ